MQRVPRIKSVMTPFPYSIAPSANLEEAASMMDKHDIRHLPVCDKDGVVGILSQREMRVGLSFEGGGGKTVLDICTPDPLLVDLEQPLDAVTGEMAQRRIGCAIVMRGDKLAGILTTTDVCRIVTSVLRGNSPGDDDVA